MSYKNKLQELCQKEDIALPVYKSKSSGLQHEIKWESSVSVVWNKKKVCCKAPACVTSKIKSQNRAAYLMLKLIRKKKQARKPMKPTKPTKKTVIKKNIVASITDIYLIDLENKPAFKVNFKSTGLYVGFINTIHHSIGKYKSWHKCESDVVEKEIVAADSNLLLYCIEGGTADLSDHFLTLFSYPIVNFIQENGIDVVIHIITGDHAGWCSRACIEKILNWRSLDVKIVNSTTI